MSRGCQSKLYLPNVPFHYLRSSTKKDDGDPQDLGTFKLNIDSASFFDQHAIGVGAILRDSKWEIIIAASIHESGFFDSATIECLTMFKGLQLCLKLDIHHIVIKSNCQALVNEP